MLYPCINFQVAECADDHAHFLKKAVLIWKHSMCCSGACNIMLPDYSTPDLRDNSHGCARSTHCLAHTKTCSITPYQQMLSRFVLEPRKTSSFLRMPTEEESYFACIISTINFTPGSLSTEYGKVDTMLGKVLCTPFAVQFQQLLTISPNFNRHCYCTTNLLPYNRCDSK